MFEKNFFRTAARLSPSNLAAPANRRKQEGKIFAVPYQGQDRFPRYGLDEAFRPIPGLESVLKLFGPIGPWRIAVWFESTNAWLDLASAHFGACTPAPIAPPGFAASTKCVRALARYERPDVRRHPESSRWNGNDGRITSSSHAASYSPARPTNRDRDPAQLPARGDGSSCARAKSRAHAPTSLARSLPDGRAAARSSVASS